jgi:hypothetical protein
MSDFRPIGLAIDFTTGADIHSYDGESVSPNGPTIMNKNGDSSYGSGGYSKPQSAAHGVSRQRSSVI